MLVAPAAVRLWRVLLACIAAVAGAGLAAELIHHLAWPDMPVPARGLFSLSFESNLPTWLSTCLLFSCGLALWSISRRVAAARGPYRARWRFLALFFFYMSLDEFVGLHEHLGDLVELGGPLYYGWVVPASVIVAIMGMAYLPFVRHLEPPMRRRVIVAGCVYVGGALGVELALGWWADHAGDDNLVYALIDLVEETMEMLGAGLFLAALWAHLAGPEAAAEAGT